MEAANPGTWAVSIPAQPFNTTVLWYIMAWEEKGHKAIRMDASGYPFSYTVIKKPPVSPEEIPGFTLMAIIPITLVSIIAITIIYYRKRCKYKK